MEEDPSESPLEKLLMEWALEALRPELLRKLPELERMLRFPFDTNPKEGELGE